MDRLEKTLGSQDVLVRAFRDAFTVTAALEARQARALRERREWLETHNREMKEHDARMKILDERIANLVSGSTSLLRRESK